MRLPHDTLAGTVICGVLLTGVLYTLLYVIV